MQDDYISLNRAQPGSERDPFTVERYAQFYRHFPAKAQSVLDIGCNTGRGGKVLKELNGDLQIFGLDALQERVDALPAEAYSVGLQGFSTCIPASEASFDVVVAGELIEHILNSDVDKTISEIFRTLKIGGRLLLTTPNPLDLKRRWRGESILGGAHVSQHFPDDLAIRLRMSGFSRVKIYGSGKVSRHLGSRFPLLIYGSYLATADKF